MNKAPSQKLDQYIVRLPDGMRDRLKAEAAENNRSMNAEIVARLDRYPSLGGEVEVMWEIARALADEIDKAAGSEFATAPLFDKVNDAFSAVDLDTGEVDRAKVAREFREEAAKRLASRPEENESPIFNFVLDAKGYPLSWPEMAAHVYRTAKAAGLTQISSTTVVFNTATDKEDEKFYKDYARLIRWYQQKTREHKDFIRSDDAPAYGLEDDVKSIIATIGEELAGKTVGPAVPMKSELGEKLSDAITDRSRLAMEVIVDALLTQGLLSEERREEIQSKIDSTFKTAA